MSTTNVAPNEKQKPEVVERFVSLSPSEFFLCISEDAHEHIKKGHILLVTSIDYVDNSPHTVYVRLHPSEIANTHTTTVKFLVAEFLNAFEHVTKEKAKSDRDKSIGDIQNLLSKSQTQLQAAICDTDVLDDCIAKDTPPEENKNNSSSLPIQYEPLKANVVNAIQTQEVTALMNPSMTESGIEQIKNNLEHHKNLAVNRAKWITKKTNELSKVALMMTPYFEEQSAMALAATNEMTEHIEKIMKGIGNLNLYVLKNVEISKIVKGKSAPSDIKLTIAQSVLYMDEELAVHREVDETFDCTSRDVFYEELKNSKKLIKQLFPTERCVIGIATTRSRKDYAEMGYSASRSALLTEENNRVFFLVRDGENISVVLSPECFHQFSNTLYPSKDELEAPFRGFNGTTITYNDINYTRSLSAYKRIELAYKRMLILLCGLDHKESLFGHFYEGEKSLDFVSMEFQEQYFNFIHDADGTGLIDNPFRPKDYNSWISELNSEISSGSRVLILWRMAFSVDSISGAYQRLNQWHRSDSERDLIYTPVNSQRYSLHTVKMHNGRLVVDIEVEGENSKFKHRQFTTQLDIKSVLFNNSGRSIFCLDRFKVEDAEWYLQDRASRTLNVTGIHLLKDVIEYAKIEREIEKPLHDALSKSIRDAKLLTNEQEIIHLVDLAIAKWRNSNPKKQAISLLENTTMFNEVCDQIYQLSNSSTNIADQVIKAEEALGRTVLRVTITAKGHYCAYSTPLQNEIDDRFVPFNWVTRTRYFTRKSGVKAQPLTFVFLSKFHNDETIKFEIENVNDFIASSNSIFKSPKHKANILNSSSNPLGKFSKIEGMKGDEPAILKLIDNYNNFRINKSKNIVVEPLTKIVLGHTIYYENVMEISLIVNTYEIISYLVCGNEKLTSYFSNVYSSIFKQNIKNLNEILKRIESIKDQHLIDIFNLSLTDVMPLNEEDDYLFCLSKHLSLPKLEGKSYSLQSKLDKYAKGKKVPVYLDNSLNNNLDVAFGITEPDDFFYCIMHKDSDEFSYESGTVYQLFAYTPELKKKLRRSTSFESKASAIKSISNLKNHYISDGNINFEKVINYRAVETDPKDTGNGVPLKAWIIEEIEK